MFIMSFESYKCMERSSIRLLGYEKSHKIFGKCDYIFFKNVHSK